MQLKKPSDLLLLSVGDSVTRRNLFDLIKFSKVQGSSCWEDESWQIGNTPQQGINWIGALPTCRLVIIKVRHGSYKSDGWADGEKSTYHYSFKTRNEIISFAEKANKVLIDQPDYQYPILLFTEKDKSWSYEGAFSVSEIKSSYVVLERAPVSIWDCSGNKPSNPPSRTSSEADDSAAIDLLLRDSGISSSERMQLIKARVGQGLFRSRVAKVEPCCRITGINDERFLIASHIKPWSKSDNVERLDGHNGLLLAPHIDRLFDKGYITFEGNGRLWVSSKLPVNVHQAWGLDTIIPPKPLTLHQQHYMAYHQKEVFQE
ncbi:HNH endonuclease [Castellaniella ginsengisoli]|uniref:HNH endonuclease n=2 Tax=Castellaniella TaxID=359336 RepID=A0AB39FM54_9BURK